MITSCPHCSVKIEIDPTTRAELASHSHFACPKCLGAVPVPSVAKPGLQLSPAPGNRSAIPAPRTPSPTCTAATFRMTSRHVLILGASGLLVLGGIAFVLATQKSGDTHNTTQNIRNEIINNSYFQNLIATGVTTEKDLDAITDIKPWDGGFVGIGKEMMDWAQAQTVAQRAGARILSVEGSAGQAPSKLIEWLVSTYPEHLAAPVWVRALREPRLLDGSSVIEVSALDRPRKAIFQWGLADASDGIDSPRQSATPASAPQAKDDPSDPPKPRVSEADLIAEKEAKIKGCIGGIGAMVETKDETLRVARIVPNSPSERGGLKPGQQITSIDKAPTSGMALTDVVKLLRGTIGSKVELEVILDDGEEVRLQLVREKVLLSPIDTRVLEDGLIWVNPNYFDLETPREFRELLQKHFTAKGLIIDMRGSGGGVAAASADVAGLFLPKDTELWFGREANGVIWAEKRGIDSPSRMPLVLLANGKTSYGGELFTAALQRVKRAMLIGQTTAGDPAQMRDVVKSADGTSKMRDRGSYLLDRDGTATLVVPDVALPDSATDEEFIKAALEVISMQQSGPSSWTNVEGKSIQGEFVGIDGETVVIRKEGKEFKIPLSNLSPASLAQARRLAGLHRP